LAEIWQGGGEDRDGAVATSDVTLNAIEPLIRSRSVRLPPALEAAYEEDRAAFLATIARVIVLRLIITYNVLLLIDFWVLPKTAWLSVAVHFLVVTPCMLLCGVVLKRKPGRWVRDSALAMMPVVMTLQVMLIYRLNAGENAWAYQYLVILVMISANINLQLELRFALGASVVTAVIYLGTVMSSGCPEAVKIIAAAIFATAAYLSLQARQPIEYGQRRQFLRRLQEQLRREEAEDVASRDALTGLSNRRHFDERAAAVWANEKTVAIVMIDIDHFKLFNDLYGHPAGDHCIKRVAGALSAVLRGQEDLAVRFGGEEFLLLLPGTDMETGLQIAERARRAVEGLAIFHEASPTGRVVTASVGVAAGRTNGTVAELVAAADALLYEAKRGGRNRVFPPFMTVEGKGKAWRVAG